MAWQQIQKWQESEVYHFFSEQEMQCVAASFRFRHFNPLRDSLWGWRDRRGVLRALLFFSGSVLHPLMDIHISLEKDSGPFNDKDSLLSILKKTTHSPCRQLRSIQGNCSLTTLFDELISELGLFRRDAQEYLIMQFLFPTHRPARNTERETSLIQTADCCSEKERLFPIHGTDFLTPKKEIQPQNGTPHLLVNHSEETIHLFWGNKQPDRRLYKELYELEAGYEQEEVIPQGSSFDAASCRFTLDTILKHHLLITIEKNGSLIAKANTNAWGFHHVQIGGVYVSPSYRNQGIAGRMLAHLIEELKEHEKTITLFVKKRNFPARRLYEKLGFRYVMPPWGEYRISYYS